MLKLFNTLTKKKEVFKPIKDNLVGVYTCGPTVYDYAHIGNLHSYIFSDTLIRVLKNIENYKVRWVMNITDIDDRIIDKIIKKRGDAQQNRQALTEKYTKLFKKDIKKVGIDISSIEFILATDNISQMRRLITKLINEGIAYVSSGSVYFSIDKYIKSGKKYGILANLDFNPKARVTDDQDQKEGVADFALWKAKVSSEPFWNFKLNGKNLPGRPGWHIECSVMSSKSLGLPFDIHTGGVDLIFPHHENEIAQCGGKLANYFVHNEHLLVDSHKMSKSRHNYHILSDIDDPMAFRYLCLSTHYQSKVDFSFESLTSAHARLKKLQEFTKKLQYNSRPIKSRSANQFKQQFKAAMEDNLHTPNALSALAKLESSGENSKEVLKAIDWANQVLGLNLVEPIKPFGKKELGLQKQRNNARSRGDYNLGDKLRAKLKAIDIESEDTEKGSIYWRA
ncbi:MAG: cysteine--tRNA ligase [bacterium]|nr:cysteine--tRNA ligase [bacterium]